VGKNNNNQKDRKLSPSRSVSIPGLFFTYIRTAIRSVQDNLSQAWYSKFMTGREFSPAYCAVLLALFFPFLFLLLLRVSVIFIHFNSRYEIVGCHLPFL
jgi:hypothetical protein